MKTIVFDTFYYTRNAALQTQGLTLLILFQTWHNFLHHVRPDILPSDTFTENPQY